MRETLTNDVVSFEQPGLGSYDIAYTVIHFLLFQSGCGLNSSCVTSDWCQSDIHTVSCPENMASPQ